MKKYILLLIIPFLSFGQNDLIEITEDEEITEILDFGIVETLPIFPGCETSSDSEIEIDRQEKLRCFNAGVINYIVDEFKYPEEAKTAGISEKIFVTFIIDKTGLIKNAKVVRGDNEYLKEEALRLVNGLPKMTPATQRNKPVSVSYTIPINFLLQ